MSDQARHARARGSLREMLVIVVSILVAFGLEAWWSERSEQAELDVLLRTISTEMRQNIVAIEARSRMMEGWAEASETLLAYTGPAAAPIPVAEFDSLMVRALMIETYDPQTGAIQSLLTGGTLNRVASAELRSALAAWGEQLRDFKEDELWSMEEVKVMLTDLGPRIPLSFFGTEAGAVVNDVWRRELDADAVVAILRDVGFMNRLQYRVMRNRQLGFEAADLRELMQRIVDLIAKELEG